MRTNSNASKRRTSCRARWLLAALLAFVGAEFAGTAHMAFEPHHLCAEHGVIEEGAQDARAGRRESGEPAPVLVPDHAREHDVCGVADKLPIKQRPAPPLCFELSLMPADLPRSAPHEVVRCTEVRYLLAPKHSPPLALS